MLPDYEGGNVKRWEMVAVFFLKLCNNILFFSEYMKSHKNPNMPLKCTALQKNLKLIYK